MKHSNFSLRKWFFNSEANPVEFANKSKKAFLIKKHFYFTIFVIVSLISVCATFLLGTLSVLKLAKLWIFAEGVNDTAQEVQQLLNNYIYVTNTITTIVGLMSSLIGFFAFKEGYLKNKILYAKVDFELLQFNNKMGYYAQEDEKDNEEMLVNRIFIILGTANKINKLSIKNEEQSDGK